MSPLRSEVERLATIVESDALAMTYQSLGQYRRDLLEVIRGALTLPEVDGWTPASEPPDSERLVIAWCLGRAHVALHMPDTDPHWYQCPSPDNEDWYDLNAVTHWRDAQPPTEAPAQCQRGESDGRPCGLTPPCPDCGPSLIDFPEGSL